MAQQAGHLCSGASWIFCAKAAEKGVGILALKALAKRPLGKDEARVWAKSWYVPIDTLDEAVPALAFTLSKPVTSAIPPGHIELFRLAWPRDPFKAKQLQKGLQELGEEGAIQVFDTGNSLLLGAVGTLQFEVVAQRLQSEYKVDAVYDAANIYTARWLTFPRAC